MMALVGYTAVAAATLHSGAMMTLTSSTRPSTRPRLGDHKVGKRQHIVCRSAGSVWQELEKLEVLGVINLLVEAFDALDPKQRCALRLVCKSWAVHFPLRDLVASSRDFKCISRLDSGTPCPSVGLCVCKLERLRGLARVDIHSVDGVTEPCLRALRNLPCLRELSISFASSARINSASDDFKFPSGLDSLRLFGVREGLLAHVAVLTRLTTLEIHGTPRYSPFRLHLSDISPVQQLPRLRRLCVEYWPGWPPSSYAALGSMLSLESLSLVGFSALCLQSVSRLPNLKKLELSYDGDCPTWLDFDSRVNIAPCESLQATTLDLCNTSSHMSRVLLVSLGSFRLTMKSIEFSNCEVDQSTARELLTFQNLETLVLDGCDTSERILETLRPLSQLKSLCLAGMPLSDCGLESLHAFQELKSLDCLSHRTACNGGFSTTALDRLVSALPSLKCLGIDVTIHIPPLTGRPTGSARSFMEGQAGRYPGVMCSVRTDLCLTV